MRRHRILLHIGSPKCGSTYLQQVMLQNAGQLAAHGVRYPHDGTSHPGNAADLASITPQTLEHYFRDRAHTVVLSHEDLYSMAGRGKPLAQLMREHNIRVQVFAFLRPFSEFVYGDYSQFMKQYFHVFLANRTPYDGRDFKAFAERRIRTLKPADFLRRWQLFFPDRPLILANHRQIRPVMHRLLGARLCDTLDWTVEQTRTNRSLRMEDCDRIAAAMRNPRMSNGAIRGMLHKAFQAVDAPDAGRSPDRTAWLEQKFAPQNHRLMTDFLFDNRLHGYHDPGKLPLLDPVLPR